MDAVDRRQRQGNDMQWQLGHVPAQRTIVVPVRRSPSGPVLRRPVRGGLGLADTMRRSVRVPLAKMSR